MLTSELFGTVDETVLQAKQKYEVAVLWAAALSFTLWTSNKNFVTLV